MRDSAGDRKDEKDGVDFREYIVEREGEGKVAKVRSLWALLSTMRFAIWILVALGALSWRRW
jgi:hypothetical protein